jgi:hypothetical protein
LKVNRLVLTEKDTNKLSIADIPFWYYKDWLGFKPFIKIMLQ